MVIETRSPQLRLCVSVLHLWVESNRESMGGEKWLLEGCEESGVMRI